MKLINFYDTSALLEVDQDILFKQPFIISSITLKELEAIKTSSHKDFRIKNAARRVTRSLAQHKNDYYVHIHTEKDEEVLREVQLEVTNDTKILSDAVTEKRAQHIVFVTNDLCLTNIASKFFFDAADLGQVPPGPQLYSGYQVICPDEASLNRFYQNPAENIFNLEVNEYLILQNQQNEIIDVRCWDDKEYRYLRFKDFTSNQFGKISPYNNDIYQKIAFDSLCNNKMTMLGGPPGSGKTILALGYLFSQLERGQIDKIIIFCNPAVAKDAVKLGFYKGTVEQKLMQSQIGHILASKLGDIDEVQRLIDNKQLDIIPAGDARGYEIPPNSAVYIIEAQNLTSTLLRMLLQRAADDTTVIIDGDRLEQVDMEAYEQDNGLKKMIEIFKGQPFYGQVDLKQIHRSEIARIAQNMR